MVNNLLRDQNAPAGHQNSAAAEPFTAQNAAAGYTLQHRSRLGPCPCSLPKAPRSPLSLLAGSRKKAGGRRETAAGSRPHPLSLPRQTKCVPSGTAGRSVLAIRRVSGSDAVQSHSCNRSCYGGMRIGVMARRSRDLTKGIDQSRETIG
jgi:hypothetical protein